MSTELAVVDQEVLATKKASWSKFGEAVYTTEIDITNKAIVAKSKLVLPTKIEEVPDAEALLKHLKSEKKVIEDTRKNVTSKLTDFSARLMEPEKSMDEPIKALETAIIGVKKVEEAKRQAQLDKSEEAKRIVEFLKNAVASFDANCKSIINNKIAEKYRIALEERNIQPEQKDAYLEECCAEVNESTFPIPKIDRKPIHNSVEEFEALKKEHFVIDRDEYVRMFANEIEAKFFDYAVAFSNKAVALKQAEDEKAKKAQEIADAQQHQAVANKLESVAQAVTVDTPMTKALKKSYAIDMPETIESALLIQAAFVSNLQSCLPKMRVTKWFDLKVSQCGDALAKLKCDDNNFQPSGINFKEVDKL